MKKKCTILELEPQGLQQKEKGEEDMPVKKRRRLATDVMPVTTAASGSVAVANYPVPVGMAWSQNSCAYDSVFTILFAVWCNNKYLWNRKFDKTGNIYSILLANQFLKYDGKQISLENARFCNQ